MSSNWINSSLCVAAMVVLGLLVHVAVADDNVDRLRPIEQFTGRFACYSSDGNYLAYADSSHMLRIHKVQQPRDIDRRRVTSLFEALDSEKFHERNEAFVQLRRMGNLIQTQIDEQLATENSLEVEERLKALNDAILGSKMAKSNVRRLVVSPNDEFIAVGGNDRFVTLWRASSLQQERIISWFDSTIYSLSFSPDSKLLAIGTGNGAIYIYNIERQLLSAPLEGHDSAVLDLIFAKNELILYSSGGSDRRVGIWQVTDNSGVGEQKHVSWLHGHNDVVKCLDISADGEWLVSAGYDRDLLLWNTRKKELQRRLVGHTSTVRSISFIGKRGHFLSASDDGTVKMWHVSASESLGTANPGIDGLHRVSFNPAIQRLALSGENDRIVSANWKKLQQVLDPNARISR